MRKYIGTAVSAAAAVILLAIALSSGVKLSKIQLETLNVLLIICAASAAYCFAAGEIVQNFSQMDKLWSILPITYVWIIAAKSGFKARLLIYALIVTAWGVRLTINFARKGAYMLRFWDGKEDYRWAVVRGKPIFKHRITWILFDLLFISIYQNALVLAICLPALASMDSALPIGLWDTAAFIAAFLFLLLETAADEYQWRFHQTKNDLLSKGAALESLPRPFCLGFNTTGPWRCMRHPNYLGEQGFWMSLYFITAGAGVTAYAIFNWSMAGPLLLVLLFMGSSSLGESITAKKYPRYSDYAETVFKYLPLRRYDPKP